MLSGMQTIGTWTGGDGANTVTVDMDFAPIFTLVTISISRFGTSGGVTRAGVLDFRFRNDQGFDTEVDFPGGPNDSYNALPAAVSHDQMTHITMQVATFDGWTRGLCTAFHWQ